LILVEITALNNRNVIAVYYLKTTKGNIYHRVSKDQKVINELTGKILSAFDEARQFRATEAVLISYEDMGGDNDGRLNNFQVRFYLK
jgi:predicted lipase